MQVPTNNTNVKHFSNTYARIAKTHPSIITSAFKRLPSSSNTETVAISKGKHRSTKRSDSYPFTCPPIINMYSTLKTPPTPSDAQLILDLSAAPQQLAQMLKIPSASYLRLDNSQKISTKIDCRKRIPTPTPAIVPTIPNKAAGWKSDKEKKALRISCHVPPSPPKKRKGKWEIEEERFTIKIIHAFLDGILPIEHGTTLRSFLAKQLNCDPMRITKKLSSSILAGIRVSDRIGKRTYKSCPMPHQKMKKRIGIIRHLFHDFWSTVNQTPSRDALRFEIQYATPQDIEMARSLLKLGPSIAWAAHTLPRAA